MSDAWAERHEPWKTAPEDARSPFDVDYARIIHSASFRRLQGKTQILNLGDSDFYRTRLTHSLEVAQIAGGLTEQLRRLADHPAAAVLPERALVQLLGCAHDLGHPPFGHGGEVALHYAMARLTGPDWGFEGNGQTLRLLARLEHFSKCCGANLTRRAMLGVLKYPAPLGVLASSGRTPALFPDMGGVRAVNPEVSAPPKGYLDSEAEVVDWMLAPLSPADREAFVAWTPQTGGHGKTQHKSLDCSIMDVADDIAYGVHDLEDAISLGLVTREAFDREVPMALGVPYQTARAWEGTPEAVWRDLRDGLFGDPGARKRMIGRLVHLFITQVRFAEAAGFDEPLLRWRAALPDDAAALLRALKRLVLTDVIQSPEVQHLEFKGQRMVVDVMAALSAEPKRLLPRDVLVRWEAGDGRAICDHVSAMTDAGLLKTYERLFAPRMGSVFDRL